MRIAIVSSGSSIHVKKIANELVKRGHDITLYTLPNHKKLINDFDKRIKIIFLPIKSPYGYFLNAIILRHQLLKGKYDLINTHYASGYGTLIRLTNVHPLSLAIFGSDVFEYPYISKYNMKTLIKNLENADVITSTSNVMKEEVLKYYHTDKEIYVTPFGVDLSNFHPVEICKDEYFEFGIVKKIESKYGIDLLISAFAMLCDEFDNAKIRLTIYGRGPAIDEYKKLTEDLKIADKVFFMGFINNEDVPNAFCKMNVACFPSISDSESFGVAAVEAMACGLPIITSDASGFTEVVEDGVTGIIVPKGDVNALFKAMRNMYLASEEERSAMGEAGKKRVISLYDFKKNMDDYIDAMNEAINRYES